MRRTTRPAARPKSPPARKSRRAAALRPGLSREELKRLKREQAEQRNAIYKQLKPLQTRYGGTGKRSWKPCWSGKARWSRRWATPEVYADGARASALLKEFHELQTQSERELEDLAELEARIADLEARRAALSLED